MDEMARYQKIMIHCQEQIEEARTNFELARAKEDHLDKMRHHLESRLTLEHRQHSKSFAEAERRAKASDDYKEFLVGLHAAGELKASAAGLLERIRMEWEYARSMVSAEKEKMKML